MIEWCIKKAVRLRNFLIFKRFSILAALRRDSFCLDKDADFVISIASYPRRINLLPAVFESVARQSVMPRYMFLVLAEDEWPGKKLPKKIVKLQNLGVKLIWVKGYTYSVKMLIPILEMNLGLGIVTLGDDWIYGRRFIENTVRSEPARKGHITGPLGKTLYKKGDEINMYFRGEKEADINTPSEQVYLLGLGVIYPPNSLDPKVSDLDSIRKIVPGRGSDLWFWAAARAKGTRQVCLGYDSVKNCLVPIPENKNTKPRDTPGLEIMNNRFQMAIDFFGIRDILLLELPDKCF